MVLLAAVAAVVVATVVVIQLLPNPADGPAVVGATRVALRGNRFHPPVIQITKGQTVTWSFDDNGTPTTSRARAGALATRRRGRSNTPLPRPAATGTPARCTWA
jgi:plastocyanin